MRATQKTSRSQKAQAEPGGLVAAHLNGIEMNKPSALQVEIANQWEAGNYDVARALLQKAAYGMVGAGVNEEDNARFKTLMTTFALDDPLYREVMAKLKPIVLAQPGILQSSVYARLPEYDQETVRYVAYFGHEIGDIHRRKKGRSYELLPPGRVIDILGSEMKGNAMALIKCAECGKEISNKAATCPGCGVPIAGAARTVSLNSPAPINVTRPGRKWEAAGFGLILLGMITGMTGGAAAVTFGGLFGLTGLVVFIVGRFK
jgi:hypothetical protein